MQRALRGRVAGPGYLSWLECTNFFFYRCHGWNSSMPHRGTGSKNYECGWTVNAGLPDITHKIKKTSGLTAVTIMIDIKNNFMHPKDRNKQQPALS